MEKNPLKLGMCENLQKLSHHLASVSITPMKDTASSELQYAATFWVTLQPTELHLILQRYAAPCLATLHPDAFFLRAERSNSEDNQEASTALGKQRNAGILSFNGIFSLVNVVSPASAFRQPGQWINLWIRERVRCQKYIYVISEKLAKTNFLKTCIYICFVGAWE